MTTIDPLRGVEDRLLRIETKLDIFATKDELQRELRSLDQRMTDFAERMHRDFRTLQFGVGITLLVALINLVLR